MILTLVVLGIALGLFVSAGVVAAYELTLRRKRRAIRRATVRRFEREYSLTDGTSAYDPEGFAAV